MIETASWILPAAEGCRLLLRRALLQVERGPDAGRELRLEDRPVVVGRGEGADLRLEDPTVSREHLRLEPHEDGWRLVDLGSKQGTSLEDLAVQEATLGAGQRIRLGDTTLRVVTDDVELLAPREPEDRFQGLVGESTSMRDLFGLVRKVGPLGLPVLLQGETGTGKERLARALHAHGPRPGGPYEVVDCTLLGDGDHLRSELFGHVEGAFTGAGAARDGAFVRAHGGTLLLDEVGELPLELQAKLLRVLQEGEVRPMGGEATRRVRVWVLAATNRDLEEMVHQGTFRADLLHRLGAVVLEVPPLRARGRDVLRLAEHLLPEGWGLDTGAEEALLAYPWPGNVRELEATLRRSAALAEGPRLSVGDLPDAVVSGAAAAPEDPFVHSRTRAAQLSDEAILAALEKAGGNRSQAARLLGIGRSTLYRRLDALL